MKAATVQQSAARLEKVVAQIYPATAWFFVEDSGDQPLAPEEKSHHCIFTQLQRVVSGQPASFTTVGISCAGAACYLGFRQPAPKAGYYLAVQERLKKSEALGNAYYRGCDYPEVSAPCIRWQLLAEVDSKAVVEVVNLWVKAAELASLVTLANYDRASNNNVEIPIAAGCQSLWSLPYLQKEEPMARCTVGCMDPVVRKYLPNDAISFSLPATRLVQMADNIDTSFLGGAG